MSEACHLLHGLLSTLPHQRFPFDAKSLPQNGIYFLYERGEMGHGDQRIVRVGTHTGQSNLHSRLREHFLVENKDRSIFRKNIGRALLHRAHDPFLEQWQLDLTTRAAKEQFAQIVDFDRQRAVEQEVTEHIQENFSFVALSVERKSARLALEAKLIATVAQCTTCRPSRHWLGQFSPHSKIQESGLWQVNKLEREPLSHGDIETLRQRYAV
jgi:hypothetical protein